MFRWIPTNSLCECFREEQYLVCIQWHKCSPVLLCSLLYFQVKTTEWRQERDRAPLVITTIVSVQVSGVWTLEHEPWWAEPSEEIRYWTKSVQILVTCSVRLKLTFFFGMDFLFLDRLDFFFVSMAAILNWVIIELKRILNRQWEGQYWSIRWLNIIWDLFLAASNHAAPTRVRGAHSRDSIWG